MSRTFEPTPAPLNYGEHEAQCALLQVSGQERTPSIGASFSLNNETVAGGDAGAKQFKYVKPRIGSQFQTNVPKYADPPISKNNSVEVSVNMNSPSCSDSETTRSEKSFSRDMQRQVGLLCGVPPQEKKRGRPPKQSRYVPSQGLMEPATNCLMTAYKGAACTPSSACIDLRLSNRIVPERGGLCVHRPEDYDPTFADRSNEEENKVDFRTETALTTNHDHFLVFVRNLMLQTPRKSIKTDTRANWLWKKVSVEKRNETTDIAFTVGHSNDTNRGKKRKTRELPDDDDVAWGAVKEVILEKESDSETPFINTWKKNREEHDTESLVAFPNEALGLEDDENMLECLQVKFRGDCTVAKLCIVSDLSRGRALKTRRCLKRKNTKNDLAGSLSTLLSPVSESWIRRYERLCPTVIGDLRHRPGFADYQFYNDDDVASGDSTMYPWFSLRKRTSITANSTIKPEIEGSEKLMKCWQSILDCGQTMLDANNFASKEKPHIRDVMILINKAYYLPKPDDDFGRRDSMSKHVSSCMNKILDLASIARDHLAILIDAIYDEKNDGIELESLRKSLLVMKQSSPMYLDEFDIVRKMLKEAMQWESRLDRVTDAVESDECFIPLDTDQVQQSLATVESIVADAKKIILRPRSLVLLNDRIDRAHVLRALIRKLVKNRPDQIESVKSITSMIKEANRINLDFPELSILYKLHRNVEEWTDRATVAMRSKISLTELESLVQNGEKMPVDVSELLEKLRGRAQLACDWIARLKVEVSCLKVENSAVGCDFYPGNRREWFGKILKVLESDSDSRIALLLDLAAEGLRIPVDMNGMALLQTAIDARNWSLKAKKWVPQSSGDPIKKGKIEDIRDHLAVAEAIRKRLEITAEEKGNWSFGCEKELILMVATADVWFEKYRPFLEGDNRRTNGRSCISYAVLRQIVDEADQMPVNLGAAYSKMNRVFLQTQSWVNLNQNLLQRCGIATGDKSLNGSTNGILAKSITVEEMIGAVESASKEISVDLDEVKELQSIADRVQSWHERLLQLAPKRSKRTVRGKKTPLKEFSIEDIISLADEASDLPVDTSQQLARLKLQLDEIQSWRAQVQSELIVVTQAFNLLRNERTAFYGDPVDFVKNMLGANSDFSLNGSKTQPPGEQSGSSQCIDTYSEEASQSTSSSSRNDELSNFTENPVHVSRVDGKSKTVYNLVANLHKSARSVGVETMEGRIVELLASATAWCKKAADVIDSPNDVFIEKRWMGELDNFIDEGEGFLTQGANFEEEVRGQFDNASLWSDLCKSWSNVIFDDKIRLDKIRKQRDEYSAWLIKAKEIFSSCEKRITLEKLQELAAESAYFPSCAELVKRSQKEAKAATAWANSVGEVLKAGTTITLDDAKDRIAEADKLGICCPEYKAMRNALRISRGWAARIKKRNLDQGETHINEIKDLIEEHDSFLVCLPDEVAKLKQVLCGYCICRQPYDGFMIGCDECEEWYHGSCIGVSESQAERVDKFICLRCTIKRMYFGYAQSVVSVIRKWSDLKALAKSRQQDSQRHHRKVKRELRESDKVSKEIEALTARHKKCIDDRRKKKDVDVELFGDHIFNDSDNKTITKTSDLQYNVIGTRPKLLRTTVTSPLNTSLSKVELDNLQTETELLAKLDKANLTLNYCKSRRTHFSFILKERKRIEGQEDFMAEHIRRWCVLVKNHVMVPSTTERANESRPLPNGEISDPMRVMIKKATDFGIHELPDVQNVIDNFGSIAWCFRALSVLRRRPKIEEIASIASQSSSCKLAEEKCVRILRSMLQRASAWQARVNKALDGIAGESKPFDLGALKDLRLGAKNIPMITPEEARLCNTIDDDGSRHCLCGGPSDGSFMLGCDNCDRWFHRRCVNVGTISNDSSLKWICPPCSNPDSFSYKMNIADSDTSEKFTEVYEHPMVKLDVNDISPHAPDPIKMWPVFGLAESAEANEALGNASKIDLEDVQLSEESVLGDINHRSIREQSLVLSNKCNPCGTCCQALHNEVQLHTFDDTNPPTSNGSLIVSLPSSFPFDLPTNLELTDASQ